MASDKFPFEGDKERSRRKADLPRSLMANVFWKSIAPETTAANLYNKQLL
jgi:hypothetical protein